jgi:hypothetical protein
VEEALTLLEGDLLGVVQLRKWPHAVAAQRGVVEEDSRGDQRAGERPAARLVGAGHEASAELAVAAEQSLALARRHAPRIALHSGRDRADSVSTS